MGPRLRDHTTPRVLVLTFDPERWLIYQLFTPHPDRRRHHRGHHRHRRPHRRHRLPRRRRQVPLGGGGQQQQRGQGRGHLSNGLGRRRRLQDVQRRRRRRRGRRQRPRLPGTVGLSIKPVVKRAKGRLMSLLVNQPYRLINRCFSIIFLRVIIL